MWAQRTWMSQQTMWWQRKRETKQVISLFRLNVPIPFSLPPPGGMNFSHFIYIPEWKHYCYNNFVKATLKCILLLHATPTASDTSTIILFIKWFRISHALFQYIEPWKCDLLSANYTTDTLCFPFVCRCDIIANSLTVVR